MSDWLGRLTPAERAEWDLTADPDTAEGAAQAAAAIKRITGRLGREGNAARD